MYHLLQIPDRGSDVKRNAGPAPGEGYAHLRERGGVEIGIDGAQDTLFESRSRARRCLEGHGAGDAVAAHDVIVAEGDGIRSAGGTEIAELLELAAGGWHSAATEAALLNEGAAAETRAFGARAPVQDPCISTEGRDFAAHQAFPLGVRACLGAAVEVRGTRLGCYIQRSAHGRAICRCGDRDVEGKPAIPSIIRVRGDSEVCGGLPGRHADRWERGGQVDE